MPAMSIVVLLIDITASRAEICAAKASIQTALIDLPVVNHAAAGNTPPTY